MKTYLLTGGTGFLGSQLAIELIKRGNRIIFVGRSIGNVPIQVRINDILVKLDPVINLTDIETLEGDITVTKLGLSNKALQDLDGKVDAIWHLAANLSFKKEDRDLVFSTNVTGTQNVLELAKILNCPFYYTSTAYVHGNRSGLILEDELIYLPHGFNNYYEESKYLSESFIHEYAQKNEVDFIIFRPSILIDLSGSKNIKNFGYYAVITALFNLKMSLSKLIKENRLLPKILGVKYKEEKLTIPILFPYSYKTHLNLMPIDHAIKWMIDISSNSGAVGKTFHIVNPHPLLIKTLLDQVITALNIKMSLFRSPEWWARFCFDVFYFIGKFVKPVKKIGSRLHTFKYYMTANNEYDLTNIKIILGKQTVEQFNTDPTNIQKMAAVFIENLENRFNSFNHLK